MDESIDLPSMEQQRSTSHLSGGNAAYEDLYEAYLKDPNDVPQQWREYFDRLPKVETATHAARDLPHSVLRAQFARISKMRVRTEATRSQDSQATEYERKQVRVVQMISAYRREGIKSAARSFSPASAGASSRLRLAVPRAL